MTVPPFGYHILFALLFELIYNLDMANLRLAVLGPIHLYRKTQNIILKRAKALAILGYLAVEESPQTREHLIDLLWPDSSPDAARKNLRNALWGIRKILGTDVIDADSDRISLTESVWVDVHSFQATLNRDTNLQIDHLQATLDLYRGPLLDDLVIADAPNYELWLSTTREQLGQRYLNGAAKLVTAYQQESNWQAIVVTARRALHYDNLQEPLVRTLMEAHAHLGERSEALRQYDKLQNVLHTELGVEPLPETKALRELILKGQVTPNLIQAQPAQAPQTTTEQTEAPFVGRVAEQAVLNQAFHLAQNQAQVVLLAGELGMGKSRLWQEWVNALSDIVAPLETRCLNTTKMLPFAPLIRLFNHPVCLKILTQADTSNDAAGASELSAIWLAELSRLLPQIKEYQPDLPEPAQLPLDEERLRLFEAFTQLLLASNKAPIILFVDDLHWADTATLDWLVYLVDRLRDKPLLVAGAYRPDEASTQLTHIIANWAREDVVKQQSLPQLSLAEADQIITALTKDQALAEPIHKKSGGNPYFLIELAHAWPEETPANLVRLVSDRLKRLPEVAQQILQSAAILEPSFGFGTLRRTAGRAEAETLTALDLLLINRVLIEEESDPVYKFSQPLVAALVRDELSLARRRYLHRRAAEALEATQSGNLETIAGQLMIHYGQADQANKAATYAQIAAEQALRLGAPTEAERLYRKALTLETTPERQLGLGQVLYRLGDLDAAREHYQVAAAAFQRAGNITELVDAYLALAYSFEISHQGDEVLYWAEKARYVAGTDLTLEAEAEIAHLQGISIILQGQSLTEAEAQLNQAARLAAEGSLAGLAARIQFALGNILARSGKLHEALQAFTKTISLAYEAEHHFQAVLGHNNLAYHALLAGDLSTAKDQLARGIALAEEQSFILPNQFLYSTQGEIALAEGKYDEAETLFNQSSAEAARNHNQAQVVTIQVNLGLLARERGDLEKAIMLLEEARKAVATLAEPFLQAQIDLRLAELYLQQHKKAAAQDALLRVSAQLERNVWIGLQQWSTRLWKQLEQEM